MLKSIIKTGFKKIGLRHGGAVERHEDGRERGKLRYFFLEDTAGGAVCFRCLSQCKRTTYILVRRKGGRYSHSRGKRAASPLLLDYDSETALDTESPSDSSVSLLATTNEKQRLVWFADEIGWPISTTFVTEREAVSQQIIVLLMCIRNRKFEFLHAEYDCEDESDFHPTRVCDVIQQVPSIATDHILAQQRYIGLCRIRDGLKQKMTNSKPLQEYGLAKDEIVIAIPEGYTCQQTAVAARPLCENEHVLRELKLARRSGRALTKIESKKRESSAERDKQQEIGQGNLLRSRDKQVSAGPPDSESCREHKPSTNTSLPDASEAQNGATLDESDELAFPSEETGECVWDIKDWPTSPVSDLTTNDVDEETADRDFIPEFDHATIDYSGGQGFIPADIEIWQMWGYSWGFDEQPFPESDEACFVDNNMVQCGNDDTPEHDTSFLGVAPSADELLTAEWPAGTKNACCDVDSPQKAKEELAFLASEKEYFLTMPDWDALPTACKFSAFLRRAHRAQNSPSSKRASIAANENPPRSCEKAQLKDAPTQKNIEVIAAGNRSGDKENSLNDADPARKVRRKHEEAQRDDVSAHKRCFGAIPNCKISRDDESKQEEHPPEAQLEVTNTETTNNHPLLPKTPPTRSLHLSHPIKMAPFEISR